MTALIGPNGAGKTTFFTLITGFDRPDAGGWQFDGKPVGRPTLPAGPGGHGAHVPADQVAHPVVGAGEHEARCARPAGRIGAGRPGQAAVAGSGRPDRAAG
ncbi:MAG: ATP-binding cassette domain-containing protein [Acidimicrobiales bacterium]